MSKSQQIAQVAKAQRLWNLRKQVMNQKFTGTSNSTVKKLIS